MNRGDIRSLTRTYLDEASAGFWSDAELNSLINVANQKLNATVAGVYEDAFTQSVTFNTVANTKSYALPTDFRVLRRLELYDTADPHVISKFDELHFPRIEGTHEWPFGGFGEPRRYVLRGNQFDLYPIPDAVYPLRMYYDRRLADLLVDGDIPASPAEFHDMLALYAAAQALVKAQDDPSTLLALYKLREADLIQSLQSRKSQDVERVEGYMEGW